MSNLNFDFAENDFRPLAALYASNKIWNNIMDRRI